MSASAATPILPTRPVFDCSTCSIYEFYQNQTCPCMPCRESHPLDELKFVLVKCEWVLVDGALKWKSHMITGHVKV